jgi:NAD(P)-dependent dehydrogenase (short-subunit alcohol dehydrogenase family)
MNMRFSLKGRKVMLTGATGMLGRNYARTLYDAGADLVLVDLDGTALATLQEELLAGDQGASIRTGACDLRFRKEYDEVLRPFVEGGIDILINNAALTGVSMRNMAASGDVPTCPEDVWDASLEVNLTAMFRITKQVLPGMIERGFGNVVNVSSIHGHVSPDPTLYEGLDIASSLPYSVSKAAVLSFTRYLAHRHGHQGIRSNSITLGGVRSAATSNEFVDRYARRTALGRMAEPTDYRGAMLFLCADESAYMTGSELIIDGGWTSR